jgi:hypothetical protein
MSILFMRNPLRYGRELSRNDLRWILEHRWRYPAYSDVVGLSTPQPFTSAELAAFPADANIGQGRDFELALCLEHEQLCPGTPFLVSVPLSTAPRCAQSALAESRT